MARYVTHFPLTEREVEALRKAANRGSPLPLKSEDRALCRALDKLDAGRVMGREQLFVDPAA